jgi:membrane fusion protein (multidrug efflux system)
MGPIQNNGNSKLRFCATLVLMPHRSRLMTTASPRVSEVPAAENDASAPERSVRVSKRAIGALLLAAAAAGGGSWAYAHRGLESTDDAQVDADLVAIPARTSGVVTAIHFSDNQRVKEGDLLAEIDPAPAAARLAQAEAELASAEAAARAADEQAALTEVTARSQKSVAQASLSGASVGVTATTEQIAEAQAALSGANASFVKAKLDLDRAKALVQSGSLAQSALDAAQAAYDAAAAAVDQARARVAAIRASTAQASAQVSEASARLRQASSVEQQIAAARAQAEVAHARVATAKAARDLAALDLGYTKIVAPRDGYVSKRAITVGQLASPGQSVLMLVPSDAVWITANFKETQLAKMHEGQPVHVTIDAFGGRALEGEVESFSAATGARFALLPPDNATGNFTKVVQRVPVRIKILGAPSDVVLRPGMSVDVTVDTKK